EKPALLNTAQAIGIYPPVRSVDPGVSGADRAKVALGAGEWHNAWWDTTKRRAYGMFWDQNALAQRNASEMTASDNLKYQDTKRQQRTYSWNQTIAAASARFHQVSEANIGSSAVDLYIFWSQNNRTAGSVSVDPDGGPEGIDLASCGIPPVSYIND